MKKTNNFAVIGFVANVAIREFNTASKAQFTLGITRQERQGDTYTTVKAYLNCEAWRKKENSEFPLLVKGAEVLVEGFFDPQTWTYGDGQVHCRMVCAATSISKVEKEQKPEEPKAEEPAVEQPKAAEAKPKAKRTRKKTAE